VKEKTPIKELVALTASSSQVFSRKTVEETGFDPEKTLFSYKKSEIKEFTLKVDKPCFEDVLLEYVRKTNGEIDLGRCSNELKTSNEEIERALESLGTKGKNKNRVTFARIIERRRENSMSASNELEKGATAYALDAVRLDKQGQKGRAITLYQKAIESLLQLVQLYPEYGLNKVYVQRAIAYQERIKALQGTVSSNEMNQAANDDVQGGGGGATMDGNGK